MARKLRIDPAGRIADCRARTIRPDSNHGPLIRPVEITTVS